MTASSMISKVAVYDLSDDQLVVAATHMFDRHEALRLPYTDWEKAFMQSIKHDYPLEPAVSWKQRRVLRDLVFKYGLLLEARSNFEAVRAAFGQLEVES